MSGIRRVTLAAPSPAPHLPVPIMTRNPKITLPAREKKSDAEPLLLPCPFCGGRAEANPDKWSGDGWIVECTNIQTTAGPVTSGCDVSPRTLPCTTRAAAIKAWNVRARGPLSMTPEEFMAVLDELCQVSLAECTTRLVDGRSRRETFYTLNVSDIIEAAPLLKAPPLPVLPRKG
jgi:hypothetical protein